MADYDIAKRIHTHTSDDIADAKAIGKSILQASIADQVKSLLDLDNVDNTSDLDKPISNATQAGLNLKADKDNPSFTGIVSGISKSMVGLGNVDNTSDMAKPISVATQAALDNKADFINGLTLAVIKNGATWPETRPTDNVNMTVLCVGQAPGPNWMTTVDVLLDLAIINNNIYLLPSDTLLPADDLLLKG